jgi:hypothetical protein
VPMASDGYLMQMQMPDETDDEDEDQEIAQR